MYEVIVVSPTLILVGCPGPDEADILRNWIAERRETDKNLEGVTFLMFPGSVVMASPVEAPEWLRDLDLKAIQV